MQIFRAYMKRSVEASHTSVARETTLAMSVGSTPEATFGLLIIISPLVENLHYSWEGNWKLLSRCVINKPHLKQFSVCELLFHISWNSHFSWKGNNSCKVHHYAPYNIWSNVQFVNHFTLAEISHFCWKGNNSSEVPMLMHHIWSNFWFVNWDFHSSDRWGKCVTSMHWYIQVT